MWKGEKWTLDVLPFLREGIFSHGVRSLLRASGLAFLFWLVFMVVDVD